MSLNGKNEHSSNNNIPKGNNLVDEDDPFRILRNIKVRNINRLLIGHLNINSIRNKFEPLKHIIKGNMDIMVVTETKIDDSFPKQEFEIEGYTSFRRDRNKYGGGILVYVREDIPCREITDQNPTNDLEGVTLEINLRKIKWLIFGGYNYTKSNIGTFLSMLGPLLDTNMSRLENFIILGDFNCEINEATLKDFCETYTLHNLVVSLTCFKNPSNPSSIDGILTNKRRSFQNTITIETGLSDHHKMTITVMRAFFPKQSPILVKYRNYKNFIKENFRKELLHNLSSLDYDASFEDFETAFMSILNEHATMKERLVRANNSPFMNKKLIKVIMTRSRLKNKFSTNPNEVNKSIYNKQRNYCVNLLRKVKKNYYANLNLKCITDNKKFWNTVKPFFSDKSKLSKNIRLIEGETIISNDVDVAETLNCFFSNAVKNLNIKGFETGNVEKDNGSNISKSVNKFSNHSSIIKIKGNVKTRNLFSFSLRGLDEIEDKISNLKGKKPTTLNTIPTKILINNSDICSKYICNFYNDFIQCSQFPNTMKKAEIIPSHKKEQKTKKENYRPVSILPSVSKIFEKNMHEDINRFMNDKLSPYLCGFRKGYNTQHCLMVMLEKWKKALDKRNIAGALLTDLSKAFDCLNHELLIAKLEAYGFSYSSLNTICSYLSDRKQRTKVNNMYSEWADITLGVPQGSILGPLLFNIYIYINDIFYFVDEENITNYADDTTPYSIENNVEILLSGLQDESLTLLKWFDSNYLKLNPDKCKLLVTNHEEDVSISISFIDAQFNYCPLIWVYHNRSLNHKINKLHERALRIVYNYYNSSFESLLNEDNSFTIHQRNLQKLATEMFKINTNLSPSFLNTIFPSSQNPYNLRNKNIYRTENIRTVFYGSETIAFRGSKTWALLPADIKNSKTLNEFKTKIKYWKPQGCTCMICKIYVHNLGFVS